MRFFWFGHWEKKSNGCTNKREGEEPSAMLDSMNGGGVENVGLENDPWGETFAGFSFLGIGRPSGLQKRERVKKVLNGAQSPEGGTKPKGGNSGGAQGKRQKTGKFFESPPGHIMDKEKGVFDWELLHQKARKKEMQWEKKSGSD